MTSCGAQPSKIAKAGAARYHYYSHNQRWASPHELVD